MSAAVCPYCRGAILPSEELVVICGGCETPHHSDCYEENGGCTVFGCNRGPADEPKLRVSSPDVAGTSVAVAAPAVVLSAPAQSVVTSAPPAPYMEEDHKQKVTFTILGVLLGALGAHNFYAGYTKKGLMQLGLTVLTLGYGGANSILRQDNTLYISTGYWGVQPIVLQ